MKYVDRVLQRWRIRRALRWLPGDVRLIDVGAHEGELFEALGARLQTGFGIEPLTRARKKTGRYVIEGGFFPEVRPNEGEWDAVTMLAVFEHVPDDDQAKIAQACHELLRAGGRVIITIPSPAVDRLLSGLKGLRLIDGMSLEEHHGCEPESVERCFAEPRFRLVAHRRFQLGLNHLYVLEKRAE